MLTDSMSDSVVSQLDQALLDALTPGAGRPLVLALSGGMDSVLLLSRLRLLAPRLGCALKAVHVHHGLQKAADHFVSFCQQLAKQWQFELVIEHVHIDQPLQNTEAKARAARYQALFAQVPVGGWLLTAHHADDQLETLLLALKRGAGLAGLSGIAAKRTEQHVTLVRPWLAFSQAELRDAAQLTELSWIDDPSNVDIDYDRNFLRQQVLPLLASRFPAISKTAARSVWRVQHAYQQQEQALAAQMQPWLLATDPHVLWQEALLLPRLDCAELLLLPKAEALSQLKHYLAPLNIHISQLQLATIWQQVVHARHDATPEFVLGSIIIRRFDQQLWVEPVQPASEHPAIWFSAEALQQGVQFADVYLQLADVPLSGFTGSLPCVVEDGAWLSTGTLNRRLRCGAEVLSRSLKDWCKLHKVPPWRRGVLPVLIATREKLSMEVDLMIGVGSRFAAHSTSRLYYRKA